MMKKAHFTDSQTMAILKQADNGVPIPELCREYGMSSSLFYKWRTKYDVMDASLMTKMNRIAGYKRCMRKSA
jgi:putative transposase